MDDAARALAGGLETPPTSEGGKPGFLKGPMRFFNDHIQVLGTDHGKPRREIIPVPPHTATTSSSSTTAEELPAVPASVSDEKLKPVEPAAAAPVETPVPAA